MSVDFLSEEQKSKYSQFCGEPNEIQLAHYFHLDETDMSLIDSRRGYQNWTLLLTSVRFLVTFIDDSKQVPVNVQIFVARQLLIKDISVLADYAQRDTTKREHTALICNHWLSCF